MQKKVLILGYGGTITMVIDEERKAVVPAKNMDALLYLLPKIADVAETELRQLTFIDSTDITPYDWGKIATVLTEERDHYDAFVITHGTNTLAYTASAIGFALGRGFGKPVVLTGSQLPLTVYGNDARFNFENAVLTAALAAQEGVNEVMIVFNDVVLRGVRTLKVSESSFRAFLSPSYPVLADIRSTGIHFSQYADQSIVPSFAMRKEFDSSVLTIDLVPGMRPALVEMMLRSGECRGLLLKSHGAGSVPTIGEYSFLPLIERCKKQYHIPVLITTKFVGGNSFKGVNDLPAVEALEAGAVSAHDMTDVAAQVKLMWLLAHDLSVADIEREIQLDYCGEITAAVSERA